MSRVPDITDRLRHESMNPERDEYKNEVLGRAATEIEYLRSLASDGADCIDIALDGEQPLSDEESRRLRECVALIRAAVLSITIPDAGPEAIGLSLAPPQADAETGGKK